MIWNYVRWLEYQKYAREIGRAIWYMSFYLYCYKLPQLKQDLEHKFKLKN